MYSDLAFSAAMSKSFDLANNRKASAGIRLRYESLGTTPNYPKLHFLFLDIGFGLDMSPEFSLGGSYFIRVGVYYLLYKNFPFQPGSHFLIPIPIHRDFIRMKRIFPAL